MNINIGTKNRLLSINWFKNCTTAQKDINSKYTQVSSINQAIVASQKSTWINSAMIAQNSMTMYLCESYLDEYRLWNDLAKESIEFFEHEIEDLLKNFLDLYNLDERILAFVRWNILGFIMEDSYRHLEHECDFFDNLIKVYEEGHLPCGWDGDWPSGRLMIF